MTIISMSIVALAASCVATLGASAAAVEKDPRVSLVTEKVSFADLNLDEVAGAQALYARIKAAASSVCYAAVSDYSDRRAWNACYGKALGEAVAKINRPQLMAVYLASLKPPRQG